MYTEWTRIENYLNSLHPSKNSDISKVIHEIDSMLLWYTEEHYHPGGKWTWAIATDMSNNILNIIIDHETEHHLHQQRKFIINLI